MESFSNRSKIVSSRKMTMWEKIYLPAIITGLLITIRHLFKKKVTIRFPEETRKFSDIYRGRHVLKRDDEGRERCTACGLCAVACPAEAWFLYVTGHTRTCSFLFQLTRRAMRLKWTEEPRSEIEGTRLFGSCEMASR